MHPLVSLLLCLSALVAALPASAAHDAAGHVRLQRSAVVYAGHPCNCTRPGSFDLDAVRSALPEARTIAAEGLRPDSARYQILVQAMHERVVSLARLVARQHGCDLVVRDGAIVDAGGLTPLDLTAAMLERIAG